MDPRIERLELDLALGCSKLFARVSDSALKVERNDKLNEMLAAFEAFSAEDQNPL